MALFNPLSFDEIVYKTFTYELDYFIPYYEEERSGGFNELDSDSCTDCVTIIPPQIDNPKVLISAPHATSQYRNYSYYSPDCDITPEECAANVAVDFDYGHNEGCCGKEPDHYTGALAMVVGESLGGIEVPK